MLAQKNADLFWNRNLPRVRLWVACGIFWNDGIKRIYCSYCTLKHVRGGTGTVQRAAVPSFRFTAFCGMFLTIPTSPHTHINVDKLPDIPLTDTWRVSGRSADKAGRYNSWSKLHNGRIEHEKNSRTSAYDVDERGRRFKCFEEGWSSSRRNWGRK